MTRSRKTEVKYQKYLKKLGKERCQFCEPLGDQLITQSKNFKVIQNIFGYEIWDSCKVLDHLLILPHRHISTKGDFTKEEKMEYMNILCEYEEKGYNLYARGHQSIMKSIVHQHTHLIKLDSSRVKHFFFNSEPYIQITEF